MDLLNMLNPIDNWMLSNYLYTYLTQLTLFLILTLRNGLKILKIMLKIRELKAMWISFTLIGRHSCTQCARAAANIGEICIKWLRDSASTSNRTATPFTWVTGSLQAASTHTWMHLKMLSTFILLVFHSGRKKTISRGQWSSIGDGQFHSYENVIIVLCWFVDFSCQFQLRTMKVNHCNN